MRVCVKQNHSKRFVTFLPSTDLFHVKLAIRLCVLLLGSGLPLRSLG